MQIVEKFLYKKLQQQNGKTRTYLTPEGESLPSVTTILSKTKDKSGIRQWRQKVGEQAADKIMNEASQIGTALHLYIERHVKGKGYKDISEIGVQAEKMAQKIIDEGMKDIDEIWGSEVHLYMPGKYAGTSDMIGLYKGRPAIIDFKQTNKPKKREWISDYFCQLGAYCMAHNYVYGTKIQSGVILMCSKDLLFQKFEIEGKDFVKHQHEFLRKTDQYYKNVPQQNEAPGTKTDEKI